MRKKKLGISRFHIGLWVILVIYHSLRREIEKEMSSHFNVLNFEIEKKF